MKIPAPAKLTTISILLLALYSACGSVNTFEDFLPAVDEDIGAGENSDVDAGSDAAVHGDPCSANNPWECNPVADYSVDPPVNEGCEGINVSCDYWEPTSGFTCLLDATEALGDPCDVEKGPWCTTGATCLTNGEASTGICVKFCCGAQDCDPVESCNPGDWSNVTGDLGYCLAPGSDPDGGTDAG